MLANARLAMAEYQLALFSHWSVCLKCQASEECEVANSLPIPEYEASRNYSDLSLDTDQLSQSSLSDNDD